MIPLHPSGDTACSRTTENDHADDSLGARPLERDQTVSLPSVLPSEFITWFQAQEACANSGKRLPTSAEGGWGRTGRRTPGLNNGTTDCSSAGLSLTGARSSCVSARGAFDMVGNVYEWVADWVPRSTACGT